MSKKIFFKNNGLLDLSFITLMGVSVKETDSPIGLFGTGLKYAIATTLRIGGTIEINIGGVVHTFETEQKTIRDKVFEQVVMVVEKLNGYERHPLGFTTELGKHWAPWMGFREIYSNCLDEGGSMSVFESGWTYGEKCLPDQTIIMISAPQFDQVLSEFPQYFISDWEFPLYSDEFIDVYPVDKTCPLSLFYKGIKIYDLPLPAHFRYNIKVPLELTEDRTLKYYWEFERAIERSVCSATCEIFILTILAPSEIRYESKLDFDQPSLYNFSEKFSEICQKFLAHAPRNVNRNALEMFRKKTNQDRVFKYHEMNEIEKQQLAKALSVISAIGFADEISAHPIHIVNSLGQEVLGLAHNGKIFISKECFSLGTKYLCSTILEEFVHLQYGFLDHSRPMQTWLFDRIVHLAETFVIKAPI
jgi:hypothetical protein